MDFIGNILCVVIGSGLTLVGVVYKDRSSAKQLRINNRRQAINEYLSEAGKLVAFPAMNTVYSSASAKARGYLNEDQKALVAEFDEAIKMKDKSAAKKLLNQLTDSLDDVF